MAARFHACQLLTARDRELGIRVGLGGCIYRIRELISALFCQWTGFDKAMVILMQVHQPLGIEQWLQAVSRR